MLAYAGIFYFVTKLVQYHISCVYIKALFFLNDTKKRNQHFTVPCEKLVQSRPSLHLSNFHTLFPLLCILLIQIISSSDYFWYDA